MSEGIRLKMNHPFEGANKAKSIWYDKINRNICSKPTRKEIADAPLRFIHFDSLGEYTLYQRLIMNPFVCAVIPHFQQTIYPASNGHPAIYWNIDFLVNMKAVSKADYLVEYKGNYIRQSSFNRDALQLRYQLLLRNMPRHTNFVVVAECQPFNICKGLSTVTTTQLLTKLGQ